MAQEEGERWGTVGGAVRTHRTFTNLSLPSYIDTVYGTPEQLQ